MVYACDSANNRIVAFQKNGKFVKEGVVKEGTGGFVLGGAAARRAPCTRSDRHGTSRSRTIAQQRFLYVPTA